MSGVYLGQHEPLPYGWCRHRWRNRQTRDVICPYSEGYAAGLAAEQAGPPPSVRANWHMESLIRYAVEVWGPESDVDPEADNGSMQADLETFLDAADSEASS